MSKAEQLTAATRAREALTTALLVCSCLVAAAATAAMMAAGYVGLGTPALIALARVLARRTTHETITANRSFPWIILWVILDATTLLGAGVLTIFGGSLLTAAILTTPAWLAIVPAILTLTAGIYTATPPIRSITRHTRRSRAGALA